jgi:ubiquinone/menaquinone biosynthesis C-methylase UbiE
MKVSRAQTRANYDRLSRWYDVLAGSSETRYRELGLRGLEVHPGERVLEIGPGTGHALLTLAQTVGPTGAAWGLDLSPAMCQMARQRLGTMQAPAGPAVVVCGDAISLPVVSGVFDAIFMSFTLELFEAEDMEKVLKECWRLLRMQGRLGVVALSDRGQPSLTRRMYAWAHRRFPAWIDCRPIAVADTLTQYEFHIRSATEGSMWGLPVEVVIAGKGL